MFLGQINEFSSVGVHLLRTHWCVGSRRAPVDAEWSAIAIRTVGSTGAKPGCFPQNCGPQPAVSAFALAADHPGSGGVLL